MDIGYMLLHRKENAKKIETVEAYLKVTWKTFVASRNGNVAIR